MGGRAHRSANCEVNMSVKALLVANPLTSVLGSKHVERVIGLANRSDVSRESIADVLSGDHLSIVVDLGDVDLDGGVVLCRDETVGSGACVEEADRVRRDGSKREGQVDDSVHFRGT